jgi:hypothetical protein
MKKLMTATLMFLLILTMIVCIAYRAVKTGHHTTPPEKTKEHKATRIDRIRAVKTVEHDGHLFIVLFAGSTGCDGMHHPDCPCMSNVKDGRSEDDSTQRQED